MVATRRSTLLLLGLAFRLVGCGPLGDHGGELAASPAAVYLRASVQGNPVQTPLVLANRGDGALAVRRLSLAVTTGYAVQAQPLPRLLAPGEELVVELQYRAGPGAPLSNRLEIETDGDPPLLGVQIEALPATALLEITPAAVEFGAVRSGATEERLVAVQNLGLAVAEDLRLEWLQSSPDLSARLTSSRLAPGALAELRIGYRPRGGGEDQALLRLRWHSGERLIRVSGRQDLQPPD